MSFIDISILIAVLTFYAICEFFYLEKDLFSIVFSSVFLLIGWSLLIIVLKFAFFSQKLKAEIISFKLGSYGSAPIRTARGRKYLLELNCNKSIIKKELSYISKSSYNKGDIVTVFFRSSTGRVLLLVDLIILLVLALGFLSFPIRSILNV